MKEINAFISCSAVTFSKSGKLLERLHGSSIPIQWIISHYARLDGMFFYTYNTREDDITFAKNLFAFKDHP